jgi:hypothetical protein
VEASYGVDWLAESCAIAPRPRHTHSLSGLWTLILIFMIEKNEHASLQNFKGENPDLDPIKAGKLSKRYAKK